MEFRRWDGSAPTLVDECGIGSSDGAPVVPDVVVVPCVGFTGAGHRLGFGGGYYDRWLAAHRHVVAVGVAWSFAEIDLATFAARPHDIPLAFVVTERGVRLARAVRRHVSARRRLGADRLARRLRLGLDPGA